MHVYITTVINGTTLLSVILVQLDMLAHFGMFSFLVCQIN
jgi:hypothetical protein